MFENHECQKPNPQAFQGLLEEIAGFSVRLYIDNEIPNLLTAAELGFRTIAVTEDSISNNTRINRRITSVTDLTLF